MAEDGDVAASLLEDVFAGDEAGAPFEFVGAVFFGVGGDVFLGDAVDDGSDFGPDAGAGAHGARFVGGVQDEIGEVPAIAGGDVFQGFEFDVLDGGAGSFDAVAGGGDDDLALAQDASDDGTDGIIAAVAGADGLLDGELHELFLGFVSGRDHFL